MLGKRLFLQSLLGLLLVSSQSFSYSLDKTSYFVGEDTMSAASGNWESHSTVFLKWEPNLKNNTVEEFLTMFYRDQNGKIAKLKKNMILKIVGKSVVILEKSVGKIGSGKIFGPHWKWSKMVFSATMDGRQVVGTDYFRDDLLEATKTVSGLNGKPSHHSHLRLLPVNDATFHFLLNKSESN
jgi:hypothetical protein